MTANMKMMLSRLASSTDTNEEAKRAQAADGKSARTIMALYKAGMLQIAERGGLELSAKGSAVVAKAKP